jgi:hypothetical protein
MPATKEINVSAPQEKVLETLSNLILFMAGVGSGKSHIIALLAADVIKNNPELIQFIGANTYQQLTKSTLKRVFDVWKEVFGWENGVDFVVDRIPPKNYKRFAADMKSYENTICFRNGAMVYTASLENYKVIDGTEFAIAYLDETKDTKEEAVKEVISTRLRQSGLWQDSGGNVYGQEHYDHFIKQGIWKYGVRNDERVLFNAETLEQIRSWNPLYIFTSPAKVDWLNEWFELTDKYAEINARIFSRTDFFCYEDHDRCVVISSTFHNEVNLPVGYIGSLLKKYKATPEKIDMLIYGSPIAKTGGEFIHQFKRLQHVKQVLFDPALPVHFTLDFNVAPYMTAIAAQLTNRDKNGRRKLRLFREYCLASPRNSTEDICSALASEFGGQMRGLYYYGDPSGRNRQTVSKEFRDNYTVLEKKLARYLNNSSDRVLRKHPVILTSRDFLNNLFAGTYGIDIEIDESLKNLIHDCEYAKEDENGNMMKPKVKDALTGQTYEKYGHCLDAIRYLVCALFESIYETL